MDAKLLLTNSSIFKLTLALILSTSVACSKKGAETVDAEAKATFLSSASVLLKKGYCLPNPILDEEDIPALVKDKYKLSPADQYCIPENGTFPASDYNCVPYKFVDAQDLTYLINNGYHDTGVEYCNNVIEPEPGNNNGTTTGGSTDAGSTDGGATSGGTTAGSTDGGGTTGSTTDGGATNGSTSGSTSAGSTDAGGTTGSSTAGGTDGGGVTNGSTSGSTTAGSTDAGGTTGSSTAGGTDGGGATNGSTSGSTTAGSTDAGGTTGSTTAGGTDGGGATNGSTSGSTTAGSTDAGGTTGSTTAGGTDGGGATNGDTNGGSTNGDNNPDAEPSWTAPIDRHCSQMRTGNGRYIFEDRAELVVQVLTRVQDKKSKKWTNTVICETKDTAKIKTNILEKRKVNVPHCDISGYKMSELYITIFSPIEARDLPIKEKYYNEVRFFKAGSDINGKEELSFINYGGRDNRYGKLNEKIIVIIDNNPAYDKTVDKKRCDQTASPLVVHVNPDQDIPEYVKLTSIDQGIKFDILGLNSEPVPYAPKKIGWLANKKQYMFLVKPNSQGRVNGVNEMFGDNTYGPDKNFAANGFLALAKYDKNGDGVIDGDDSIYYQLRLWNDKNLDGKGTPDEMIKLSKMKVKLIDLNYDAGYREKDKYGNETVYKSVIMYDNGSLDLIFDLWFAYK